MLTCSKISNDWVFVMPQRRILFFSIHLNTLITTFMTYDNKHFFFHVDIVHAVEESAVRIFSSQYMF